MCSKMVRKLQLVQNVAAHVVAGGNWFDSHTAPLVAALAAINQAPVLPLTYCCVIRHVMQL